MGDHEMSGLIAGAVLLIVVVAIIILRVIHWSNQLSVRSEATCGPAYANTWPRDESKTLVAEAPTEDGRVYIVNDWAFNKHWGMQHGDKSHRQRRGEVDPWMMASVVTLALIEPMNAKARLDRRPGDIFFAPRRSGTRAADNWV